MTELAVSPWPLLAELLVIAIVWGAAPITARLLNRVERPTAGEIASLTIRLLALVLLMSLVTSLPGQLGLDERQWWGLELSDLLQGAFIVGIGFWLTRRAAHTARSRLLTQGHPWRAMVIEKTIAYGGAIVILMLVADAASIDLTAVLATAGVLGIAVGWAAQTSLSNVIAGIFLLFDRPFTVGDVIMVEGQMGTVERVSLMSTFLRTFDNLVVRWPNEVVLKATITNYATLPVRRVEVPVRIPADTPIDQVVPPLRTALQEIDVLLLEPAPEVRLSDLADGGLTLLTRGWVARTDFLAGRDAIIETTQRTLLRLGVAPRVPVWEVHTKPEDQPRPG